MPTRTSRKHHSLPIQRPPIRRNPLPPEPLLHHHPPRLIKPNPPTPHNPLHLPLRARIQPPPTISRFDILGQTEIAAVESGFGVFGEGGGGGEADVVEAVEESVLEVVGDVIEGGRDGAGGCYVGDGWREGFPEVAG